MDFEKELDVYLRARFTLMLIHTIEEERALKSLKAVCAKRARPLITWDVADGFVSHTEGVERPSQTLDPLSALNQIEAFASDAVFVLLDFHECWQYPPSKRKLRTLAERLKYTKKSLIILSPNADVPNELRNVAVTLGYTLPDEKILDQVLNSLVTSTTTVDLSPQSRGEIVRAALGLTAAQAQRAFARAIVNDGRLDAQDIQLVIEEKKQVIRQSRALEFLSVAETMSDVGGLEVLKEWLNLRTSAFSEEAKEYGLKPPKGVVLIGISGTGKSLSAKMIAGLWHVPLLRFDMGAVFQKWYGESEENARIALQTAEMVAPCVLWIDEIEKGLGQREDSEGGTSARVFATILTWMQEKKAPVFVVATANDISRIPPELLRRGRFDEIFFLDLPTAQERRQIFSVHLLKRKRSPEKYDLEKLGDESDGYVGAEIEQAIVDAMVVAFHQKREFDTADIVTALKRQVPLSVSQRERIAELQRWLDDGRAQPASSHGGGEKERARLRTQLGFR